MANPDLLTKVQSHLEEVKEDPTKPLNQNLLLTLDGLITDALGEAVRDGLINQLSELLPTLQQDPAPATALVESLVRPANYDFQRILNIRPPIDFEAGFRAQSSSINLVALCLLEKACSNLGDAEVVASWPLVVAALVRLWLCTSDTTVASKAQDVIIGLLMASTELSMNPQEQKVNGKQQLWDGLMWRRLFRDKNIYGSILALCSISTPGTNSGQLSKRDKTIAQSRLLDFLPKIDCELVRTSQFPEIEQIYQVGSGGLIEFAAVHMVDYNNDVLMHMTLIDFFVAIMGFPSTSGQLHSRHLEFLILKGLHSRSMSFYLEPSKYSSLDMAFLYSRSAHYVSVYCSRFPYHLLYTSPSVPSVILSRLSDVLGRVSTASWSQGQTPKHDLHVLTSMPRVALLPNQHGDSPFFLIPAKPHSADAFNVLASVFGDVFEVGSKLVETMAHKNAEIMKNNKAAARVLYYLYLERYPMLWTDVVNAAEISALEENALAAINLMKTVIAAQWGPLSSGSPGRSIDTPYTLPTELELVDKCHCDEQQMPSSGVLAILTSPAIEAVLPYLLQPATYLPMAVGDTASTAYRIGMAKFDVLKLLHRKLIEIAAEHDQLHDAVATIAQRISQGPMGSKAVNMNDTATMER
ncbi:hypothetical protein MMC12_005289 [Toensbergia leucococca]|nr:hypothetical protein [Toensbergia leucococca]